MSYYPDNMTAYDHAQLSGDEFSEHYHVLNRPPVGMVLPTLRVNQIALLRQHAAAAKRALDALIEAIAVEVGDHVDDLLHAQVYEVCDQLEALAENRVALETEGERDDRIQQGVVTRDEYAAARENYELNRLMWGRDW